MQTGRTPRKLSDFLLNGPVVLFFYPAAMTPGVHRRGLPLPRPGRRVRRGRRAARRDQHRHGGQAGEVRRQAEFDYPLLSDADGEVATQFGVKRGLLGKLMPVKRTTFVIDTDRTVLDVIASEVSMDTHADKALEVLRARKG